MSVVRISSEASIANDTTARWLFAGVLGLVVGLSFLMSSFAPIVFSIVTVFLFAGPHNWFEGRYMISRMPAKWGPLAGYFVFGIVGVILLTGMFASLPLWMGDTVAGAHIALASWNTALVAWIVVLALWRSRQNPRREWYWLVPVAFLLLAVNWTWPWAWSLCLVYIHPLVAMTFFDREIARRKPQWLTIYRSAMGGAFATLLLMYLLLGSTADLHGNDLLSLQITRHAGAGILQGVSTRFLVAAHTFLEVLHYAIWILAMPLLCVKAAPWNLSRSAPLAKRSTNLKRALLAIVGLGAAIVVVLWGGFLADYPATRDIYFTVAMLHVLAEVPFLLRLL